MRILHVIQPLPRQSTLLGTSLRLTHTGTAAISALRELIASDANQSGVEHFVVCLGGERSQTVVRSVGIRDAISLTPPLGNANWSAAQLRRLIATIGPVNTAIAWGGFAGNLAFKLHHEASWIRASVISGVMGRLNHAGQMIDGGISLPWKLDVTPRWHDRAAARQRIGLPASQPCIGLLADTYAPADATDFTLAVSVLHAAGLRLSAALPADLPSADRAKQHVQRGTYTRETAFVNLAPRSIARAADVCIVASGETFATGLLMCEALAAGTAVVLTRASQRALGIDLPELGAVSSRATDLARVALPLFENESLREDNVRRYREAIAHSPLPNVAQAWHALARTMV